MLRDLGSRDIEFINTVKEIRRDLVKLGNLSPAEYTAIPMQGSGTFAVESVITTFVPKQNGKLLIISNGSYGTRIESIAKTLGINNVHLKYPETQWPDLKEVEDTLKAHPDITNVATVHCETSAGIINPVEQIGALLKKHIPSALYFVDAMSSFGGVPLDIANNNIHFVVSSANKCIQGVPGFGFILANKERLLSCAGQSRSLSLDLVAQYKGLETEGQFRFTPPTHPLLAFRQAMRELEEEGGVPARSARYQRNKAVLQKGMTEYGFRELLSPAVSSYIITTYVFPSHPNFKFSEFYSRLNDKNFVIYPGKVTQADCFRIGSIGHLFPSDVEGLLAAIKEVCADMNIPLPLKG
jgi:2-aminoethylphosphonate-pyruvate transaminase